LIVAKVVYRSIESSVASGRSDSDKGEAMVVLSELFGPFAHVTLIEAT